MVPQLALVWLSSSGSLQAHQADLDSWSRAQRVHWAVPGAASVTNYDPAVAEGIESQLELARTAVIMEQADAADRLGQASAQISAHPELPQSAWLRAECERIAAQLLARANNAIEAASRLAFARALEGERAAAYDEQAANLTPLEPAPSVEIEATGLRSTDALYFDGVASDMRRLSTPGMHHVRVLRASVVLYSGWLEIPAQGGKLPVPISVKPCSAEDLSGVSVQSGEPNPPADVSCPDWAVATTAADGSELQLTRCHGTQCGRFQPWPAPVADRGSATSSGGAAWYVWPLIGAGVVLGTTVVLWQTGAFDNPKPAPRTFTFTGPANNTGVLSF
ncbi:MAG TPA: hypothetical protein VL137_13240 [Polyangiaceae bacterium]|nr:hypothetical protein [Polyangiaceae bacterium]